MALSALLADKKRLITGLVQVSFVVLLIAVLGFSIKMYMDSQAQIKALQESVLSGGAADSDGAITIEKVGKHLVLPDETPRVVTIDNVELLRREQPFFQQAQNGDILLIYTQKVVLYNPQLDKVVDIAQIRAADGQAAGVTTDAVPVATDAASQPTITPGTFLLPTQPPASPTPVN